MNTDERKASLLASFLLDNTGYSSQDFKRRQEIYTQFSEAIWPVKFVGSKREVLTNILESDFDQLRYDLSLLVIEKGLQNITLAGEMNTELCSPGYAMIFLYDSSIPQPEFLSVPVASSVMVFDDLRYVVSSSKFIQHADQRSQNVRETIKLSKAGPSIPHSLKLGLGSYDFVLTLPCRCPSIFEAWLGRPRRYEWPSEETRQRVVSKGANLVPHGCDEDAFSEHEWRICFNLGEIELTQSLNETLKKVYIFLKMVVKQIVKPKNKEVTSYILKNTVFWICESNPWSVFTEDSVYYWFRRALRIIKISIIQGYLPYYMIPARNLLQGKLSASSSKNILRQLTAVLRFGPSVLFFCRKPSLGLDLLKCGKLKERGQRRAEMETEVQQFCIWAAWQQTKHYGFKEMSIFDFIPIIVLQKAVITLLKKLLPDLNELLNARSSWADIINQLLIRAEAILS